MSQFAELSQIADDDVKVILGEEKKTNDLLIDQNPDVKALGEHLDEVEERNATTIELMKDTDIATESRELTEREFAVLRKSLKAITGTQTLQLPAMESGEAQSSRTIAMEGFKETLKKFWSYIKSALLKFWNMLKRWWFKTFDISKRALGRAKKLRDQADREYGVSTENTISFPEVKKLAMDGKYNDIPLILKGFKDLEEIVFEFIETRTSDKFNDTVEELSDQVTRIVNKIKAKADEQVSTNAHDQHYRVLRNSIVIDDSDLKPLNAVVSRVFASNESRLVNSDDFSKLNNSDKYLKQYGEANNNTGKDTFLHSALLPGDKWLLSVQPKQLLTNAGQGYVSANDSIDYIRRSRIVVADCRFAGKTYDADATVKVLQPTVISRGCESIIKICEYINEYRIAFEQREKFKDRVIKEIDQTVNDVTGDNESSYSEVDRLIRSFANAVTGLIRRRSDFETNLCAYSMSTSVAFLNYSELSLKQYTG